KVCKSRSVGLRSPLVTSAFKPSRDDQGASANVKPVSLAVESGGWMFLLCVWNRGRPLRFPAAGIFRGKLGTAIPRHLSRGFSPRVTQLDADGDLGAFSNSLQNPAHGGLRLIIPQADVGVSDPAFRQHRCRLDCEQCCARKRQMTKVDE